MAAFISMAAAGVFLPNYTYVRVRGRRRLFVVVCLTNDRLSDATSGRLHA